MFELSRQSSVVTKLVAGALGCLLRKSYKYDFKKGLLLVLWVLLGEESPIW